MSDGSFFIGFLDGRVGFGVARAGREFAPAVASQQAVGVGERDLAPGGAAQVGQHLAGREELTLDGLLSEFVEQGDLFVPREKAPTASAAALAIEPFGAVAVVLADPQPDGLNGDAQAAGDLAGGQTLCGGEPDGQTPLVLAHIAGFTHPKGHLFFGHPRSNLCRFTHEHLPPELAPIITL